MPGTGALGRARAASSPSDELKVARMQGRRLYAHQRDRVPATVNLYHRIATDVIMKGDARRQRAFNFDHAPVRIEMIDRDCANRPGVAWSNTKVS